MTNGNDGRTCCNYQRPRRRCELSTIRPATDETRCRSYQSTETGDVASSVRCRTIIQSAKLNVAEEDRKKAWRKMLKVKEEQVGGAGGRGRGGGGGGSRRKPAARTTYRPPARAPARAPAPAASSYGRYLCLWSPICLCSLRSCPSSQLRLVPPLSVMATVQPLAMLLSNTYQRSSRCSVLVFLLLRRVPWPWLRPMRLRRRMRWLLLLIQWLLRLPLRLLLPLPLPRPLPSVLSSNSRLLVHWPLTRYSSNNGSSSSSSSSNCNSSSSSSNCNCNSKHRKAHPALRVQLPKANIPLKLFEPALSLMAVSPLLFLPSVVRTVSL